MAPLDVVAVITAKSGSEAIVEAALKELAATSKGDQGCITYELFASDAPGAFVTIERWESQADIDAHMASPHIMQMIRAAGAHLEGSTIHTLRPVGS
jgi:quinol monooxygenase YgiN